MPTLWIVGGPTSAGKSQLLGSARIRELTSLGPDTRILFPRELDDVKDLKDDSYLHYNLLRPLQRAVRQGKDSGDGLDFGLDPKWRLMLELPVDRRAIMLVADTDTLVGRARGRVMNEEGGERTYKHDKWLGLYERIDIQAVYRAWRDELARQRIPCLELDATSEDFPALEPGVDR